MNKVAVLLAAALLAGACGDDRSSPAAGPAPGPTPAVPRMPIGELPEIDAEALMAHTRRLSSDEFAGRAPGTRGETLTVNYLVEQFKRFGLKPGNTDGAYVQKVPLVGITAAGAPLAVSGRGASRQLTWGEDFVAWTKHVAEQASIERSELVFVGYGVEAPEFDWNDYKEVDLKGKTLLMLVNDPPVRASENGGELDPRTFAGRAMTYYGRWTYKFEIAAQKGAAAAFIIHETEPAGYPFSVVQGSNLGERFDLVTRDKNMGRVSIEGWVTLDRGRELLKLAGHDFDELKQRAVTREFAPVPLGLEASLTLRNKLRTLDSQNVIAKLEGRDPKLKDEYVVYTAHWDHLGVGPGADGDPIYNGAKDNAAGTAGVLEIARAFTRLPEPPRRSILFLAVTAEEQGLLGSQYYTVDPIYPLARTVANINIDAPNVMGRTSDLILVGYGASDLDDYIRDAAGEQGRLVKPDPDSQLGYYYRSDHFNFAKQGVPALYVKEGHEFLGQPAEFGDKLRRTYTESDYHKPSDVVKPEWDLAGLREDLTALFAVGYRVAEADRMPEWKPGNEFKAIRDEMLKRN